VHTQGGNEILKKLGGYVKALFLIFPEIGLDVTKFGARTRKDLLF
jgi:hypothetical protein